MTPALQALLAVTLVSLISLVGVVTLSRDPAVLRRRLPLLVSLAAGVLVGSAVVHLLPEAREALGDGWPVSLLFLAGFLGFFGLERALWFHHHPEAVRLSEPGVDLHPPGHGLGEDCVEPHPVVWMNLIGDGAHNLIDGVAIGAAFMVDPATGVATTLAIILHEVPQEIGDFAILVHGGLTVRRALLFNLLSALVAVVGVGLAFGVGQRLEGFSAALLAITAGSFIYIAGANLIPEIHRHRDRSRALAQTVYLLGGVGITLVLRLVVHG